MDVIRLWLNGNKNYYTGLVLFIRYSTNEQLKQLFRSGDTPYNVDRLEKEMNLLVQPKQAEAILPVEIKSPIITVPAEKLPAVNEDLYHVAKDMANMAYKEVMNLRAELFALARVENWEDCNRPDKIQQRSKMAIDVVIKYNRTRGLFESADFTRTHGRLETTPEDDGEDYASLPDHLVKQKLDNLRKSRNKLKNRPVTPGRMETLQKHDSNIKKLEARWQLLRAGM